MAIDFPSLPTNGQIFVATNGITYTYQSPPGRWNDTAGGGTGGTPSGSAGGDLAGTYPNPTVNPEAIDDRVAALLVPGSNVTMTYNDAANTLTVAAGSGSVTDVSVVSANGFAGTVATSTSTPAITLSTTATGMLKGNGTAIGPAAAGTDYLTPSGASALYLLKSGGTMTGDLIVPRLTAGLTLTDATPGAATTLTMWTSGTGNKNAMGTSTGSFDFRSVGAYNFYYGPGVAPLGKLAELNSAGLTLDGALVASTASFTTAPTFPNDTTSVATTAFVTDAIASVGGGGGGGISDAPNDGNVYGRKNLGWTEVIDISSGTYQNYLFNAGTVAPPALGSVRFNNVSQNATTAIYMSFTTNDTNAVNLETYWTVRVKAGDFFYFQDKDDPTKWKLFELIASYTDSGNYATMAVAYVTGGNDLTAGRIICTREGASVASPVSEDALELAISKIDQNAQTGNYTLVAADAGKHIYHAVGAGAGDIYTIPANASVAYPVGTTITFVNDDATNAVSIAVTTDTMVLSPGTTTGTRTLATGGIATAIKVTSTRWLISGTGLT